MYSHTKESRINGPYNADDRRYRIAEKKIKGICICCKEAAEPNSAYCIEHYQQEKERFAIRKINALKLGNCIGCYKNKVIYGKLCDYCWFKEAARRIGLGTNYYGEIWIMLEKQDYKCGYSGIPITPGINASLDHMIPSSRGGLNILSNLIWCDLNVNQMKRDLTTKEFIINCQNILRITNNDPNYFEVIDNRYKSPRQTWLNFEEEDD